jgi:methyltransferase family protein
VRADGGKYAARVLRRIASRVSLRSRTRKLELFLETLRPGPETSVVDVGVTDAPFGETTDNFFEAMYPWPERITAVGVTELERFAAAFPQVRIVQADGRELPFADGEFDVAFSNAVVEHVGGRDAQRALVHELCRVARSVFVTTPNRWFPIEVHTLLPFVHWLPRTVTRRLVPGMREIELLSPAELRSLFPYPVRVVNSGMTLIAIGGRE